MNARIIFTILMVWCYTAIAQNTGQKIERAGKQVNEAVDTFNTIKGIFGKKKNKSADSVANKENTTKEMANPINRSSTNIYYAGKISNDVRYIDCDELYDFNMGAAIIKKGNSYALINSKGDFIIPFNKYSKITEVNNLTKSGIFDVNIRATNGFISYEAYINSQGKELIGGDAYKNYMPSEDGKHLISITENQKAQTSVVTVIDSKGIKKTFSIDGLCSRGYHGSRYFQDSVIVFNKTIGNKTRYGFKALNGFSSPATFETLENFFYGLAEFSKTDEYGKVKYGFVNRKGEIILQPKFSQKLYRFRGKYVYVNASQDADFESALIDQTGKIIFKNTKESIEKFDRIRTVDDGFAYSSKALIDDKGLAYTQQDFFKKIGITIGPNSKFKSGYFVPKNMAWVYDDNNQRFTLAENTALLGSIEYNGLYNVKTGKVLLIRLLSTSGGISHLNWNDALNAQLLFDSESGLARVTLHTDKKDKNGSYIGINGYIDGEGVVKIIREAKKSEW